VSRPLHLDEGLPRRLAAELRGRGRDARSAHEHGGGEHPLRDRDVIEAAARAGAVLVTTEAGLAREHRALLHERGVAVALVPGDRGEAAKRDVVHRWAHRMAAQAPGTVVRWSTRPAPARPVGRA
jgi:hypothetical protein